MDKVFEQKPIAPKEYETNPSIVAVATSTMFPGWYEGPTKDPKDADKARGDLALKSLALAHEKGYQVLTTDASSEAFQSKLKEIGVVVAHEDEKGKSPARRKALSESEALPGVKYIWVGEAEKISVIEQLDQLLAGFEEGVDIVIPKRSLQSFDTYPPVQADFEQRGNDLLNQMLKDKRLLPNNEFIDFWVGVRLMRNDPAVTELFKRKYEFERKEGRKIHEQVSPDRWTNFEFLSVINALKAGKKIKSVEIEYIHPKEQTETETDSQKFNEYRETQFRDIIISAAHLLRDMEGKSSQIRSASSK